MVTHLNAKRVLTDGQRVVQILCNAKKITLIDEQRAVLNGDVCTNAMLGKPVQMVEGTTWKNDVLDERTNSLPLHVSLQLWHGLSAMHSIIIINVIPFLTSGCQ